MVYIWIIGACMKRPALAAVFFMPSVTLSSKQVKIPKSAPACCLDPLKSRMSPAPVFPPFTWGNDVNELPPTDLETASAVNTPIASLLLVGLHAIH